MSDKPWWHPEALSGRLSALEIRAKALVAVRAYFSERGFVEVETPALQISPGMEPHLMALPVELHEPSGQGGRRLYLHTSPEFAMKKLLAGGMERIFQVARVWRDRERSPLHHPEFTLLEWYRAHEGYEALMEDCAGLLAETASAAEVSALRRGGMICDPQAEPRRLTVAEAFERFCSIDLFSLIDDPLSPTAAPLAEAARRVGLFVSENDTFEDVFHRIVLDRIELKLGDGAATILYEYPISMAALARPSPRNGRVAERFELYVCGVELANAFGELTDVREQHRRFAADQALKERLYGLRYPIDEDFLAALESGMPESAGIALGFDRLVMLLAGAEAIEDVLWSPVVE